jgi:hypothetical protein
MRFDIKHDHFSPPFLELSVDASLSRTTNFELRHGGPLSVIRSTQNISSRFVANVALPVSVASICRIDDPLFTAANQFEVSVASEATPLNGGISGKNIGSPDV